MQRELGSVFMGDTNILGNLACRTAYSEGGPWLDALLEYLKENRNYVRKFLQEQLPQVTMAEAEGLDAHAAAVRVRIQNLKNND